MTLLGKTLQFLRGRGFYPVAAAARQRSFQGTLSCKKGNVNIKLTISDWDFLCYPEIRVLEWPDYFPALMPHVDLKGNLCYFAPGSVTLDSYDPVTAIAQCLGQATVVLNRISTDSSYCMEDIQYEFRAHWEWNQPNYPWIVFLGDIEPCTTSANYFIMAAEGKKYALITSHRDEALKLSKALSTTLTPSRYRCWLLKTGTIPFVPEKMPQTVKELFDWTKNWDKDIYLNIQNALSEKDYLEQKYVTFAINTPVGWIGFGFDLDQKTRLGYGKNPKRYRNYLHNKGGHQPLFRMSIQEIGSGFVHNRNLSFNDLSNKRVTVVGCGAIGSFVTNSMIRLGAGIGKTGKLKIIDPDKMSPENLGRHTLGYPSLFQFKAEALKNELQHQFPHSNVEAITSSAFEHKELFATELIIDATGEESVSELLNKIRLLRKSSTPMLHVWIRGNGEAVQALWTDKSGGGCYRCLLIPDKKIHRRERVPLLKGNTVRRTDGCRAYTPYAVSAPMHAAALATDMVCAWLHGDPSPRFRTRCLEKANVFKPRNQNLSKMKNCPACDQI